MPRETERQLAHLQEVWGQSVAPGPAERAPGAGELTCFPWTGLLYRSEAG